MSNNEQPQVPRAAHRMTPSYKMWERDDALSITDSAGFTGNQSLAKSSKTSNASLYLETEISFQPNSSTNTIIPRAHLAPRGTLGGNYSVTDYVIPMEVMHDISSTLTESEKTAERTIETEENGGRQTPKRRGWNVERMIGSRRFICWATIAVALIILFVVFLEFGLPLIKAVENQ